MSNSRSNEEIAETVARLESALDTVSDGDGNSVEGEESKELFEAIDTTKLLESIDIEKLPNIVNFEEVPAAIANADPKRAIELKRLVSLVEFDDLLDAVEVQELLQGTDVAGDILGSSDLSDGDLDDGMTQAMQVAVQSKLQDAAEELRSSVLDAREQLEQARDEAQETIEETTGGGTGQPSSQNPTAYSTMASGWKQGDWSSAKVSTVPRTVRYSSASGHDRLYGSRFDRLENDDE
ncbi:hypothetical protein [Halocatena pleomorpha]|uniref:Uncharacterized protein n=1 Tax=Halocatena pleomorpha TaxID=1785090 RepID=A0A3P3R7X0_9EURY|nr:hypothetical protein [Halocatena pleomorpha]RRJ29537.1 hypothetical protein EIK79_12945 [Halocatena pleomorpha]